MTQVHQSPSYMGHDPNLRLPEVGVSQAQKLPGWPMYGPANDRAAPSPIRLTLERTDNAEN